MDLIYEIIDYKKQKFCVSLVNFCKEREDQNKIRKPRVQKY